MSSPSLLDGLLDVASRQPGRVALWDASGAVTFEKLVDLVCGVAVRLRDEGLAASRIAVLGEANRSYVAALFGVLGVGGVAVPLSPLYPAAELARLLHASGARALLSDVVFSPPLVGVPRFDLTSPFEKSATRFDAPAQTAVLLFTSGTTGQPKGAPLGHAKLCNLSRLLARAWALGPDDVLVHALPLHHLHGLGIALLSTLLAGGAVDLRPFDPAAIWSSFERATLFMAVPTMHKRLLDAFDAAAPALKAVWRRHAGRLRLVTSGSAALPVQLGERWRELHGRYPLERFGMTEIGVGMSNPLDAERRPGSCGPPLEGMQVRIVDERGDDVGPDRSGEIWIRGPTVFEGYDAAPEATREAFAGDWFKTGDVGEWLDGGYVRVLGRASVDILKSGGYKLSALEIEAALRDHPSVGDVAVVGLPDEEWGEIVVAAVLPHPARPAADPEELRAWLKRRIAPYKVPRAVRVLDELPRNALGKVNKRELGAVLATLLGRAR